MFVATGCEIGGRQVAQATCKCSVATYFGQLFVFLFFCSGKGKSYIHTQSTGKQHIVMQSRARPREITKNKKRYY